MGDGDETTGSATRAEAIPTLLPGARMVSLYGTCFTTFGYNPTDEADVLYVGGKGAHVSGAGARLHAAIPALPGSRIVQFDYYGFRDAAGSQTWWLMRFDPISFAVTAITTDILTGTGALTGTSSVNELVLAGYEYAVMAQSSAGDPYVRGAIVQYLPPAGDFIAVAPVRVYDSRISGGRIATDDERVVPVSTKLGTADVAVPVGSRAVALNLTITQTAGVGWLSVRPAGTAWNGTSTINWAADGARVANGTTSSVDNDRQIAVLCGGGGSTHFLLDVVGYYL